MGNQPGRIVGGICSLGLSELCYALSPGEKKQVEACQHDLDAIRKQQAAEKEEHEKLMSQRQAEARALQEKRHAAEREYQAAKARTDATQAELSELEKNKTQAQEDVEKLKKLTEGDVKSFAKNQEFHFNKQMEAVEKLPDVPKTPKNSCAFMGKTSTGKTSTINKLFGTQEKTAPIRCTTDIKPVHVTDKVEVFDVFGENDEESYHQMDTLLAAKQLHKIVIVYTEAVDSVLKLARLVKALRVDKVYVRNKSEDLTPEETELVLEHDVKKLQEVTEQVPILVLTSAKTGLGMDKLKSILEAGAGEAPNNRSYGKAAVGGAGVSRASPH